MNTSFLNPLEQAAVDKDGVLRWKGTNLIVSEVSLRKAGITDPDILRAHEEARLNDFLRQHRT